MFGKLKEKITRKTSGLVAMKNALTGDFSGLCLEPDDARAAEKCFDGTGFAIECTNTSELITFKVVTFPENAQAEINKLLLTSLMAGFFLGSERKIEDSRQIHIVCPKMTPKTDVRRCKLFGSRIRQFLANPTGINIDEYFD